MSAITSALGRPATVAATALLLAACTTTAPPAADTPAVATPDATVPEGDAGSTAAPGDCAPEVADRIDAAIDGQLEAFAGGEWEQALTFATPSFRSGTSAEEFEQVILGGFPVAADDATHTQLACVDDGRAAQVVVELEGASGDRTQLLYLMELTEDRWRIGGAVPHGESADDGGGFVV